VTDIIPREDIAFGQSLSPVWRRFFEKAFRNLNATAGSVTVIRQTVTQIQENPADLSGKQDHSGALDQLTGLLGPGFVERTGGGYVARLLDLSDIPADIAVAGDALVFDGVGWHPGPVSGSAVVTISDTPPTSPRVGDLWADSSTGVIYLRYDDGTTVAWVEFGTVGGSSDAVPTRMSTGQVYSVAADTQALFSMPIDVGDATLDVSGYLLEVN